MGNTLDGVGGGSDQDGIFICAWLFYISTNLSYPFGNARSVQDLSQTAPPDPPLVMRSRGKIETSYCCSRGIAKYPSLHIPPSL